MVTAADRLLDRYSCERPIAAPPVAPTRSLIVTVVVDLARGYLMSTVLFSVYDRALTPQSHRHFPQSIGAI
ncbi:hypothetical protein ACN4EG_00655 [Alkalinema pantanalense CENA528]|uniref:hypothetical protein n=1 Tax=Alkalinema pantanalense TaxID=1620705 RepID=UPI003D6F1BBA